MPTKKIDPATTTGPLTEADAAILGNEYQSLELARIAAEERQKQIKARFESAYDFGNYVAGPAKVSVQHNVQRDNALVLETFPPEEFPQLYKPAVDGTALKRELTGAQYESLQREGAPKIIVTFPFGE